MLVPLHSFRKQQILTYRNTHTYTLSYNRKSSRSPFGCWFNSASSYKPFSHRLLSEVCIYFWERVRWKYQLTGVSTMCLWCPRWCVRDCCVTARFLQKHHERKIPNRMKRPQEMSEFPFRNTDAFVCKTSNSQTQEVSVMQQLCLWFRG